MKFDQKGITYIRQFENWLLYCSVMIDQPYCDVYGGNISSCAVQSLSCVSIQEGIVSITGMTYIVIIAKLILSAICSA